MGDATPDHVLPARHYDTDRCLACDAMPCSAGKPPDDISVYGEGDCMGTPPRDPATKVGGTLSAPNPIGPIFQRFSPLDRCNFPLFLWAPTPNPGNFRQFLYAKSCPCNS